MYDRLEPAALYGQRGFLGAAYADLADLGVGDVAMIGAPCESRGRGRDGSSVGPRAVRDASQPLGDRIRANATGLVHLETGLELRSSLLMKLRDLGDACSPGAPATSATASIYRVVREAASRGAVPVVVGGDTSARAPSVAGVTEAHEATEQPPPVVVCLSADLDFGDGAAEGRSTDCKIVWVGVNGYVDMEAYRRSHRYGELLFTADDVRDVGIDAISRQALDVAAIDGSSIYVSIDMAVVDPSFAPGTRRTNWGGISDLDLLRAVTILCGARVVGADLVGVVPRIDPASLTAGLAAIAVLHVIGSSPTPTLDPFS